jgi:phage/plasmid-like protein (TIGR03299 family)
MADYFDTGFTVRTASWHGKETLLAEAPEDWDDARMAAGLMWEPRLVPLYYRDGDGNFVEDPAARRVERDDSGAGIGTVSGTFELVTHAEMGQIMEPVLAQPGCKLDTMGSVREGRMVYASVLLDEPYTIRGDVDGFGDPVLTLPYFAILNSHDGTGACKGLFTQVRVVCANTVQASAADGDRTGAQFTLRHTSGVKARISEARDVVDGCRAEAARWREVAEQLALIKVSPAQQMQFLSEFIPMPPAGVVSDRVRANVERDQARFLHVLRDSATNCEMQFTGLGLVNASVEYLDHLRGFRNQDTLVGRQLLGTEPLKAKAVRLVRDLVGAN